MRSSELSFAAGSVYREMDKESTVLLNAVAGLKLNLSEVKGDVDMCKAWEDYAK